MRSQCAIIQGNHWVHYDDTIKHCTQVEAQQIYLEMVLHSIIR